MLRKVFLGITLLMTNRVFEYYPGVRPFEETWFLLSCIVFVAVYPALKISMDWTFSKFEIYLLILMPVLFLLPAFSAWNEFGQPIWYGVLAQRAVSLIATWLIFMNVWRRGWIRLDELKFVMLTIVWISFGIYIAIRLTLNPQNYILPGFVNGVGDESIFNPPNFLLIFGTMYYGLMALRQRRLKYYLIATALFLSSLGSSGRSLSLCMLATLLYFLIRWRSPEQIVLALGKFLAVAAVAAGLLFIVSPKSLIEKSTKYVQAISVVIGAVEVDDPSANARLIESAVALPYVQRHPWVGAGLLSAQWHGGPEEVIGAYFFPGDIGMLGVLYSYGILGLSLLAAQFFFAAQLGAKIPKEFADPMLDGTKGFLLCSFLFSLSTGLFAFDFEATIFFFFFMSILYDSNRTQIDALRTNLRLAIK